MRFAVILLLLSACTGDETISGYAGVGSSWTLTEIDGGSPGAPLRIQFADKGQIKGAGPCNSFAARQTAPYPWIEITEVVTTERACDQLAQETRFLAVLSRMSLAEVSGDILVLTGENGQEMVFARAQP